MINQAVGTINRRSPLCCPMHSLSFCVFWMKKALIACATRLHDVQNSAEYGVELSGEVNIDFGKVMRRMRRIRSDISEVSCL